MKKHYQGALRQTRGQSPMALKGFAADLFSTSWSYVKEDLPEVKDQASEKIEKEDPKGVTEKTKIMDSLHEFAQKRFEREEKSSFNFPGGEAVKKASNQLFEEVQITDLDLMELKELSSSADGLLSVLKFDRSPLKVGSKNGVRALFVASETMDLAGLRDGSSGLEAFFDTQAAQLFERMLKAMKLEEGEFFVSSLELLANNKTFSFKESLSKEIFNLRPEVVVPLGGKATSALLGQERKLQSSHGQFFERSIKGSNGQSHKFEVMPLFSPAFLVEAPNTKRIAWEDMQKMMKKLGL